MNEPIYFIALYFLLLVILGISSWLKIKTPSDYYIAGKKAKLLPISGSLLATILGGSAILGTIELSQSKGWAGLWFILCASIGLFCLAPLSKYVSRYGKFTLPGLLGSFYGNNARYISSLVIPIAWLGIIGAQIIAAAKILSGLGFISYQGAAITAGSIFIFYTLIGGQISILKTDIFQSILIISGLIILTIFAIQSPVRDKIPPLTIHSLFNESFSLIDLIVLILTYSVTFVVGPDIYSRVFCAKDEKTATRSIIIVAIILIPISFILTFLGIYSSQLGSNEIISFARDLLPDWFYGLFIAALLSAVMSSADTTLLNSSLILSELFNKNIENRKSLKMTKIFIILLGCLSIITALFITSILQSLLLGLTFFSGAFVVPMLAGLLNLKVIKQQVTAAITFGGIVALTGKLISLWSSPFTGNLIIISAFIVNSLFLFIPIRKGNRHEYIQKGKDFQL